MTRNKTLALISSLILIFSIALYFAAQTLSPREYSAPAPIIPNPDDQAAPAAKADIAIPQQRPPSPISALARPSAVRPATSAEISAYENNAPQPAESALIPKGFLDVTAHSYGKKDVVIAERPSALVPSSVWKYDPTTRALITLIDGERGAMFARSANGTFTLSSRTLPDGSVSLIYEDTRTKERRPLRFATIPPKCFLEGDRAVLYCGVPLSLPPRAVLPDDYLKRKFYTDDRIVMVDLENIRVTEIPTGIDTPLDAYDPRIISDTLVFTNRIDDKIYALSLP